MNKQRYLGDSVYAAWDGPAVTLFLNNGEGPKNEIVMEPAVIEAFLVFLGVNAALRALLVPAEESEPCPK